MIKKADGFVFILCYVCLRFLLLMLQRLLEKLMLTHTESYIYILIYLLDPYR